MGMGSFGGGRVTGVSNVMQIKSMKSFASEAMKATGAFVSKAQKMSSGVSGNSKIHVTA